VEFREVYLMAAMNADHATAVKASIGPLRSVVSRTWMA
jgi:hypothetical protein